MPRGTAAETWLVMCRSPLLLLVPPRCASARSAADIILGSTGPDDSLLRHLQQLCWWGMVHEGTSPFLPLPTQVVFSGNKQCWSPGVAATDQDAEQIRLV